VATPLYEICIPQPFYGPFFPGPPGWAGARRELLGLYGARGD